MATVWPATQKTGKPYYALTLLGFRMLMSARFTQYEEAYRPTLRDRYDGYFTSLRYRCLPRPQNVETPVLIDWLLRNDISAYRAGPLVWVEEEGYPLFKLRWS